MHLELIQNTSVTELVNPELIDKLYDLSLNNPQQGIVSPLDNTSVVLGRLQVYAAYEDAVKYLVGINPGDSKRFPNLYITVTNDNYFIRFKDSTIFLYCLDNYTSSGSTGVTKTQVEAVTSANFWGTNLTPQQKSEVQTLEDFLYFIGTAGETENIVLDFTNATKIKFPSATFTNNSIYSRDIIRGCRNISQVDYSNAVFYSRNTAYYPILGNDVITEFNSSLLPNQNDFENICLFGGWTKLTKIIFPEGIKNTRERFEGNKSLLYAEFPSTIINLGDCYSLGRNSGHRLPCMVVKAVTPPDWYGWDQTDTGGTGNGLGWEQIPLAIYVPDNSVTAYKSVANGGTNNEQLWARLDIKSIIKPLSELPLMYREMGTVTQADIDRT